MSYTGTHTTTTTNPGDVQYTQTVPSKHLKASVKKINATYIVSQHCWRQKILPRFEVNETLPPPPFPFCAEFPLTHRCASYTQKSEKEAQFFWQSAGKKFRLLGNWVWRALHKISAIIMACPPRRHFVIHRVMSTQKSLFEISFSLQHCGVNLKSDIERGK